MKNEIDALENILVNAMLNRNIETLDRLLHQDLMFVDHFSNLRTKQDDLDFHQHPHLILKTITVLDRLITMFGDTAVVVSSKDVTGTHQGFDMELRIKFTRIWKKFDNTWQIIATSGVRIESYIDASEYPYISGTRFGLS